MAYSKKGIPVSPGVAIGPAYLLSPVAAGPFREPGNPEQEAAALEHAVEVGTRQLTELGATLRGQGLAEQAGILDAQAMMLADPSLLDRARTEIRHGVPATSAVRMAADHFRSMLIALDDPYLAARAADIDDVAGRLIRRLNGVDDLPPLTRPSIVVASDLQPSETAALDRSLVLGLATDSGSPTSHVAILARALGLPAIVGLRDLSSRVASGIELALDGDRGEVVVEPEAVTRAEFRTRAEAQHKRETRRARLRRLPATTRDGHRITLAANIGSPEELDAAHAAGAEGVGLFRTEFLFGERATSPSEDEQERAYRAVLAAFPNHRVVIRTLDVGGDKPLAWLPAEPEANPFLGLRGLRYCLAQPEVLRTQLRALLRASAVGRLSIMFPMVSEAAQVSEVQTMLASLRAEIGGHADVGIMIEIPAAALAAEDLARDLDFLSVGSNDLTQYTLAIDRTNPAVAGLYHPLHPALLRLLRISAAGAHRHGIWIGICGELAGDSDAIPLLLGLGYDELSMAPGRIPAARERIRALDLEACRALAAAALTARDEADVRQLVAERAPAPAEG